MKNLIYVVTFSFLLLSSCEAQSEKETTDDKSKNKTETLNQEPRFDIRVNKKYDESGNQIGFDSTYTSYYSNIEGDTTLMDSLFNQFNLIFKNYYSDVFNKQFDDIFFNDSMFYDDFFHTDFFRKRFEKNDEFFKKIMEEMDSMKNEFYQKHVEISTPKKK